MANKAHTATLNRICQKLGVSPGSDGEFDIRTNDLIVEVETSASISDAVERLRSQAMPSYIAVTNKEGITFAKSQVEGTSIGIMDPKGNIIVECSRRESPRSDNAS